MNGAAITFKILKGLHVSSNVGHVPLGEGAGIELGHRRVGCLDYPDNLRKRSLAPLIRKRRSDALRVGRRIVTYLTILCEQRSAATAVGMRNGRVLMRTAHVYESRKNYQSSSEYGASAGLHSWAGTFG
jgi:hypothetical protein